MSWLESDQRYISAQGQPTAVLDLCLQRGIDSHRLLRGTGLFTEDILKDETLISPQQYIRLLDNAEQLLASEDTAFQLGQRLLPGSQGAASQLLTLTQNLQQALQLLVTYKVLMSPVISPSFFIDQNFGYLYWRDNCGLGRRFRFILEANMVSIIAFSRRLYGEHLPWQLHFRHQKPRYVEQYWVHMGNNLEFGQPVDVMIIPRQFLTRCWQSLALTSYQIALYRVDKLQCQLPAKEMFLDKVYTYLVECLKRPAGSKNIQLESVSDYLQISPATLKRKLRKHETHFQQQLDLARLHVALYFLSCKKMSNYEVSQRLHFNDSTSFRRAFKRWTGCTPNNLLESLNDKLVPATV